MSKYITGLNLRQMANCILFILCLCLVGNSIAIFGADADNPFATPEEKAADSKPRTWSDARGKFKIEAKLLRIDHGNVVLRRTDDKEISVPLDKLCEDDQKYVANITGITADGEKKSSDQVDSANAGSEIAGPAIGLRHTDYTKAKSVDLSGSGQWTYVPDIASASEKLPAARVALEAVDFFDQPQRILFLPKEKKAFVVYYEDFKKHSSLIQACNLENGKMDSSAIFAESEVPLDISPDGALVLSQVQKWGIGGKSELHLYTRDGKKVKPLAAWKPFQSSAANEHENDLEVRWAAFTDSNHVLTISTFGKLVYWELPSLRPIWCTGVAFASNPILSPGRKYLILANSETQSFSPFAGRPVTARRSAAGPSNAAISIIKIDTGTEVGHLPLEQQNLSSCLLALRDDAQQLAIADSGRIRVFDLQTKEQIREFGVVQDTRPVYVHELAWAGDAYLLLNNQLLVDLQRRIPVWNYDANHGLTIMRDGKVWYLDEAGGHENRVLASAVIPGKQVAESVKKLNPDDLLVIHPGMQFTLDVQQLSGNEDEINNAKQALEERVKSSGMALVGNSKNRLVASVQPGKSIKVRYHAWAAPLSAAQEHEVTPQVLSLTIEVDGEPVWKYESSTSPPGILHLKEGETVEQTLERSMREQGDTLPNRCANVWIPTYLARLPGGAATASPKKQKHFDPLST